MVTEEKKREGVNMKLFVTSEHRYIHTSMVEHEIDGIKRIIFYLICNNNVIASAAVAYPYDDSAYLMDGFVVESHRKKGLWKYLYTIRCEWIKNNSPTEYFVLFVDEKNPMKEVYERYGFESYLNKKGETAKTDEGDIWLHKKIENG